MRVTLEQVGKSAALPLGFVTILQGITLALADGEQCLLTGPSGSGKTTLLAIMAGITAPTSGRVVLDGKPLSRRGPAPDGVALVFQEPQFFPALTVLENLLAAVGRSRRGEGSLSAELLLEQVGLAECSDLFPMSLSSGQQRRLGVARALCGAPRLLLCDELLTGLDGEWQGRVMALITETVRRQGATLVLASSGALPGTEQFRKIELFRGKVVEDGGTNH